MMSGEASAARFDEWRPRFCEEEEKLPTGRALGDAEGVATPPTPTMLMWTVEGEENVASKAAAIVAVVGVVPS
jgi:hypothetical protein